MKNLLSIRSLAAAVLLLTSLLTSGLRAQDQAAVAKADQLISGERTTIATLCHPTATLDSLTQLAVKRTASGFSAEYKLCFTSALGNAFNTRLAFYFDNNGRFTRQLTVTGTSTMNPLGKPFAAAGRVVDLLKGELLKVESVKENPVITALVERADAEILCELLLWVENQ